MSKTTMVSSENKTHVCLSERIKQAFRKISIISNMDIIHNKIHIHRILKLNDRERTWVASLVLDYYSKSAIW